MDGNLADFCLHHSHNLILRLRMRFTFYMDKTLPYWDKFARGLNFYRMLILDLNIDHVVRVEFKGPSTVGTPGMSHAVAHSAFGLSFSLLVA